MQCQLFSRCQECLNSLNLPSNLFNHSGDKCYFACCYKDSPTYSRGGKIYEMPIGGCRFGLKINNKSNETEQTIFKTWHNSYHGTKTESLLSILQKGSLLSILQKGLIIPVRPGHIPNKLQIYSSGSFLYASFDTYAPAISFKGRRYKFLLQLRQKPGSYEVQKGSLKGQWTDKFIEDQYLEYFTTDESSIVIIGLIVYEISDETNPEYPPELTRAIFEGFQKKFLQDEVFLRKKFKQLRIKHPNVDEMVNGILAYIDRVNNLCLSSLKEDIIKDKRVGNGFTIGSNATSFFGAALCFFPVTAPLGICLAVGGGAAGIGTAVGTHYEKNSLKERIKNMQNVIFPIPGTIDKANSIINDFYSVAFKDYCNEHLKDSEFLEGIARELIENGNLLKISGDAFSKMLSSLDIASSGGNVISAAGNISKTASAATKGLSTAGKVLGAVGMGLNVIDIGLAVNELNNKGELEMTQEGLVDVSNQLNQIKPKYAEFQKFLLKFK